MAELMITSNIFRDCYFIRSSQDTDIIWVLKCGEDPTMAIGVHEQYGRIAYEANGDLKWIIDKDGNAYIPADDCKRIQE